MKTLGDRIKEIRKNNNLNQKEFAEKTCVSPSYISKVESNKEIPTEMLLKLISLEFGVSFWWLKDGSESPTIENTKIDYFERTHLENYHSGVISELTKLVEQIRENEPSEIDVLINALIVHLQIISADIGNDKTIKTIIFDNLVNMLVSYSELVSNLTKLDTKDKSYENKIFYNLRLITVDIEEKLIELGNHFCEKTK